MLIFKKSAFIFPKNQKSTLLSGFFFVDTVFLRKRACGDTIQPSKLPWRTGHAQAYEKRNMDFCAAAMSAA